MTHGRLPALVLLALAASCARETRSLPPLGEALIVVDTDLPVPRLAGRLRVDFYKDDGTWYESRDLARPSSRDWPVSFSVYAPDPDASRTVVVRLRAYAEGKVRDYRGERYLARPPSDNPLTPISLPPATEGPWLARVDGEAGTAKTSPATEPLPSLTIDRLLRVQLSPGARGSVRVLLHGACVGTMADLAKGLTCTDTENERAPIGDEALDPDMTLPTTSHAGEFGREVPCTNTPREAHPDAPLFDEEVCVPGGAFVLGGPEYADLGTASSVPERIAVIQPLWIDRYEVTVARWRAAVDEGFVSPDASPEENNGPIPRGSPGDTTAFCSYSAEPIGRENFAVTCLTRNAAREFCKFIGGDLPTEAEWEWVATAAGRPTKTIYPWGGSESGALPCERAVFERFFKSKGHRCVAFGFGPTPVDAAAGELGDRSIAYGIVNLGGGVTEMVRDDFVSYASRCWASSPMANPSCTADAAPNISLRGGNFAESDQLVSSLRREFQPRVGNVAGTGYISVAVGFRCARPGGGP